MTVVNPKSISGINSITMASGSDNLLTIHTSDASSTERVRINSSGDVIVGSGITVSPDGDIFATGITTISGNLKVGTGVTISPDGDGFFTGVITATSYSGIDLSAVTGATGDFSIADKIIHTGDTNTAIRFPAADTISAETSGSERLRIDASGRLVIGHTSNIGIANHNGRFQLHGTDYDTATMSIVHNGNASHGPFLFFASQRSGSPGGSTVLQNNDAVGTIRFHAGDGTDMASYCAAIQVHIDGTPGSNDVPGRITFSTTADGASSPTERLRITSDGKAGLGRNDPAYALDIKRAGYSTLRLNNSSETGHGSHDVRIVGGGSNYQNIYFEGSTLKFNTYNGSSVGERFRIRSTGGVTFNGDTADANALDDYEEGTFTPNWDAGGGVTFSYSQQHGWYTKIGNTVTFTLYLQAYAATITGGNENNGVALQGLPFTIHNNNRYYPAFTIGRTYKFDINSDQRIYSYGDYGSTNARFIMETDDSIGNIMVANQLNQNTCEMFLSGTYRI